MPLRILEISAPADNFNAIKDIAEEHGAVDFWHSAKNKDGRRTASILVHLDRQQEMTDALQKALYKENNWRIIILPVEATIPKHEEKPDQNGKGKGEKLVRGTITREELYHDVEKGTNADFNFLLLVVLSTLVCAIGLIEDNVAVVIGAMVIAPLLGPNLALAFGAALGDRELMSRAIKCNAVGLSLTLAIALIGGLLLPYPLDSIEILDRTHIGYAGMILALASGAAAVLSLTAGLSSALVGVMVAVALMPPAVTMGLMAGAGQWPQSFGAMLLLLTNIVCVSLAAQLIFLIKGIKPRTWYMQKKSKQSVKNKILFWVVLLATLVILIAVQA